jgi:hypothetical protein
MCFLLFMWVGIEIRHKLGVLEGMCILYKLQFSVVMYRHRLHYEVYLPHKFRLYTEAQGPLYVYHIPCINT